MLLANQAARMKHFGIRQISFFEAIKTIKENSNPDRAFHRQISYDQMNGNCFRNRVKPESGAGYEFKKFWHPNHEKSSFIDTIHTGDLTPGNVANSLLANAIKNNRETKSLDRIVQYYYNSGLSTRLDKSFNLSSIFIPLITKLHRTEPEELQSELSSAERYCYRLALPAYGLTHEDSSGYLSNEQFIAAEYDLLHSGIGLNNAESCISDLLAKKRIYDELFLDTDNLYLSVFKISGKQCLMSLDQYKQNLMSSDLYAQYLERDRSSFKI